MKIFRKIFTAVFLIFLAGTTFLGDEISQEIVPEAEKISVPAEEEKGVPAEKNSLSVPEKIVVWYSKNLNFGSVALLMAFESTFIPFPREIVIPPAAFSAMRDPESSLSVTKNRFVNVLFVVLAGTLGALFGALFNYFLARIFGRPLVNFFANSRLGNACLIDGKKVEKSENFFVRYGIFSTFFGRLVPVVRQLISIPAGLSKMRILPFCVFTFFGAFIWNAILAVVGIWASGQQEIISKYSRELSFVILGIVLIFCLFLCSKLIFTKKKN